MRAIGLSDDVVAEAEELAERAASAADAAANPEPEIWEDCRGAWDFFRSLRGQWSWVSGMSSARTGLPSDRVEAHMRLKGIRRSQWRQLFEDVGLMEHAVLAVDTERAAAAAASAKES